MMVESKIICYIIFLRLLRQTSSYYSTDSLRVLEKEPKMSLEQFQAQELQKLIHTSKIPHRDNNRKYHSCFPHPLFFSFFHLNSWLNEAPFSEPSFTQLCRLCWHFPSHTQFQTSPPKKEK